MSVTTSGLAGLSNEVPKDSSLKQESRIEDSSFLKLNNVNEDSLSDNESVNFCGIKSEEKGIFGSDFVLVDKKHPFQEYVENRFLSYLVGFCSDIQVVSVHINVCSSFFWRTKLSSFQVFIKAYQEMGKLNLRRAWFSASKTEIIKTLSHGFTETTNNGIYGRGVYLSPIEHTIDCLQHCVVDEDGMMHMVLCRVIMGKMELIRPISQQFYPSSNEYDSGVDDLLYPKKYIMWNSHLNTHIFPVFVFSFKSLPNIKLVRKVVSRPSKKPKSPWMLLSDLIAALSKILPEVKIRLLQKHHHSFKEKKMSRDEIIKKFREIAGDELLVEMIKLQRNKVLYPLN